MSDNVAEIKENCRIECGECIFKNPPELDRMCISCYFFDAVNGNCEMYDLLRPCLPCGLVCQYYRGSK